MIHKPVLLKQVLQFFNPKSNQNFVDCTISEGGHSLPILEAIKPHGKILGIDLNPVIKPQDRLIIVQDNFANLAKIIKKNKFENISGILFDLGWSTWQLLKSKRGFSFKREEPLDMRFSGQGVTAQEILNKFPEQELEKLIRLYGQDRNSKAIAKKIIKNRPLKTTLDLAGLINNWGSKARVFQAVRIAVNQELENLKKALPQAMQLSKKVAVITFHSLEDKIVKNYFKSQAIYAQDKFMKLRTWQQQEKK